MHLKDSSWPYNPIHTPSSACHPNSVPPPWRHSYSPSLRGTYLTRRSSWRVSCCTEITPSHPSPWKRLGRVGRSFGGNWGCCWGSWSGLSEKGGTKWPKCRSMSNGCWPRCIKFDQPFLCGLMRYGKRQDLSYKNEPDQQKDMRPGHLDECAILRLVPRVYEESFQNR